MHETNHARLIWPQYVESWVLLRYSDNQHLSKNRDRETTKLIEHAPRRSRNCPAKLRWTSSVAEDMAHFNQIINPWDAMDEGSSPWDGTNKQKHCRDTVLTAFACNRCPISQSLPPQPCQGSRRCAGHVRYGNTIVEPRFAAVTYHI